VPNSSEIRRHKAMSLALKGELEDAKAVLEEANQIEQNGLISITLLVVENELGNTEAVEEIKTYLKSNEVEIPQRTQDYLNGKLSIQGLFGEGTGDIE
jgi:Flp pilus assembly protein TadD